MRYIYPEENNKYKKYIDEVNNKSLMLFRVGLEELLKKETHTEDEERFIEYYNMRNPLGMRPCTINRICWKIEEEFDKFFDAIEEHPEVIEEVDFLLVDEYQDVNANQVSFFEMINAKNTFVVGDDWQCIFTFSGSDPQYFKDAAADPKNTVYYLKNNYRTPRKIVKFATEFLRPIKNKIKKTTSCQVEEEGILEEVYDDLPQIIREIEKSGEFGKWFVLTRSNEQIIEVMSALERQKIPCDTFKKGEAGHEDIQRRMKEDTVKVLTIHSAKGLENDYVAVYRMSLGERVKEEERFVAYVAATRARKRLIWCYWNSGNKKRKPQIVSWEN